MNIFWYNTTKAVGSELEVYFDYDGDSDEDLVVARRIIDQNAIGRVVQKPISVEYTIKRGDAVIGKLFVNATVNCDIPSYSGPVAQIASYIVNVVPISNSSGYSVKSTDYIVRTKDGSPASIDVGVPEYYNNTKAGTIHIVTMISLAGRVY